MKLLRTILQIWPRRWVATALVVLAILYLTLVPRPLPDNDIDIPGLDKVVHAVMFFGLAFVATIDSSRRGKRFYRPTNPRSLIVIAILVVVFGGAIEIAQDLMNMGRGGDILDFIADCVGACFGTWLGSLVINSWLKHYSGK